MNTSPKKTSIFRGPRRRMRRGDKVDTPNFSLKAMWANLPSLKKKSNPEVLAKLKKKLKRQQRKASMAMTHTASSSESYQSTAVPLAPAAATPPQSLEIPEVRFLFLLPLATTLTLALAGSLQSRSDHSPNSFEPNSQRARVFHQYVGNLADCLL